MRYKALTPMRIIFRCDSFSGSEPSMTHTSQSLARRLVVWIERQHVLIIRDRLCRVVLNAMNVPDIEIGHSEARIQFLSLVKRGQRRRVVAHLAEFHPDL